MKTSIKLPKTLYGILDHDSGKLLSIIREDVFYVFTNKKKACRYAAKQYMFATYSEAKRAGYCEVIRLK